jgi:hypothetical protein
MAEIVHEIGHGIYIYLPLKIHLLRKGGAKTPKLISF